MLFPQRKYYVEKMWSRGKTAKFRLRRLRFHAQICQGPEEEPSASSLSESVSPFIKWGLLHILPCKKALKKWKVNKGSRTSLPCQSNFFLHVHYSSVSHINFCPQGLPTCPQNANKVYLVRHFSTLISLCKFPGYILLYMFSRLIGAMVLIYLASLTALS